MSHGSSTEWKKDNAAGFKTKLGLIMFFIYFLVYAGFIYINVTNPKLMGKDIGSLNLAIVYGFGLIIFAVIIALLYNFICSKAEEKLNKEEQDTDKGVES